MFGGPWNATRPISICRVIFLWWELENPMITHSNRFEVTVLKSLWIDASSHRLKMRPTILAKVSDLKLVIQNVGRRNDQIGPLYDWQFIAELKVVGSLRKIYRCFVMQKGGFRVPYHIRCLNSWWLEGTTPWESSNNPINQPEIGQLLETRYNK